MTLNPLADMQAFIARAQAEFIDVRAEGETLKLIPYDHHSQVAARANASAALAALDPHWQGQSGDVTFDAGAWLAEHAEVVQMALDYVSKFGRPVVFDGRMGLRPNE